MTRKEFAQIAMLVQTLFERQDFLPNEIMQNLWFERLRQYPQDTVKRAVMRLWEMQKWLPAMSEMLESIEAVQAAQRSQAMIAENEARVVRFCQMLKSGGGTNREKGEGEDV